MNEYKIGMVVKGKVTGIQTYGVFIQFDHETQGLLHISEISHGFIRDISDHVQKV